ncbi:MAG: hypothetical protein AABX63_02090 [Nanoarchaeota archaeon]
MTKKNEVFKGNAISGFEAQKSDLLMVGLEEVLERLKMTKSEDLRWLWKWS